MLPGSRVGVGRGCGLKAGSGWLGEKSLPFCAAEAGSLFSDLAGNVGRTEGPRPEAWVIPVSLRPGEAAGGGVGGAGSSKFTLIIQFRD